MADLKEARLTAMHILGANPGVHGFGVGTGSPTRQLLHFLNAICDGYDTMSYYGHLLLRLWLHYETY